MCLICVDLQRQRMTAFEARRALGEMVEGMTPEHLREVQARIQAAEEAAKQAQQAKGATPSTSSVAGAAPGSSATSVSTS